MPKTISISFRIANVCEYWNSFYFKFHIIKEKKQWQGIWELESKPCELFELEFPGTSAGKNKAQIYC